MSTVTAEWVGPFDGLLPDGTVAHPGERYEVDDTVTESGHWAKHRHTAHSDDNPPVQPPQVTPTSTQTQESR